MINLYSGTPGSGKSLNVARRIRDKLLLKNSVSIGNFQINTSSVKKRKGNFIYVENYRLNPKRLIRFSLAYSKHIGRRLKEDEILLVIDEAQLLFNARDWQAKDRYEWLAFFTQHRKFGYEIILVTQMDRMIDRQVRGLIENQYVHRKVTNAGKIGKFVGFFTGGKLFFVIEKWYPIQETTKTEFFLGSNKLFKLYDTYSLFSGFNDPSSKNNNVIKIGARGGVGGPPRSQSKAQATVL